MIRVQSQDFDIGAELAALSHGDTTIGGVTSFVGYVRDLAGAESLSAMTLEHYPGMTEKELERSVREAEQQWHILDGLILRRVGVIAPADSIVLVAIWSLHRLDAFEACRFIMEALKSRAPFWKKESLVAGERWVDKNTAGYK